ncbi:hypothetical protein CRE_12687 [Caenorhabditis remanei]|uniref:Uncharacterized protein n=1 Tax=Caenorhabditis remanei TaxID=31234 RepID=E3M7A2_CAERE|nr:hypothetical protein CRE_12687 [Caenorhabditis remanei]
MNVEEYFPEGLSVIHPDESQGEGRTSNRGSHKLPAAVHCHICYKNISGPINNVDYIKPCDCQLMFVHVDCATRNRKKFGEAKCSNCGQGNTIPRSTKMLQSKKTDRISSCCSDNAPPCTACHDKNYQYKPFQEKLQVQLGYKISPCFCRRVFHYGCLRPFIEERPLCSKCSVVYSGFEPATPMQFFRNKWAWFIVYISILSIFTTLFVLAVKNSLVFTKQSSNEDDINKEISKFHLTCKSKFLMSYVSVLTILSVFFFVVIASTMLSVIKYSISTGIPKFKITHGKVTLKPYKNGSQLKSPDDDFSPSSERDFEEIPLNDLRTESAGDVEEPIENARGNDNDDMTLGQHMFGVYATHHSSSTPIDKPSLEFVFNSV